MMKSIDYLVIGSGIAGLTFAIKTATKFPNRKVCVITKTSKEESNTKYAQGGIASVCDIQKDSFEKHIEDTLQAGDGLCDPEVVQMVIKETPERIADLIRWGTHFDHTHSGKLDLGKEGGHSEYRILHHKDITGYEIETSLLQHLSALSNVELYTHHFAIDLITEHQLRQHSSEQITCYGAYVMHQKTGLVKTIKANATVLATGGIGKVYGHTTNPDIATGDGIAMAYRAKALISDMEFIQFHPTALFMQQEGRSFLISEAVRGFGAYLRNENGVRFMPSHHEKAELASRDIVARAIDIELKQTGKTNVYLDCTHLDLKKFKHHFPSIFKKCVEKGINLQKDWIPVVPASHYLCGGIVVDQQGKTTVNRLYACGECSRTGLHGANRLASNSLAEALTYAHHIHKAISLLPNETPNVHIPYWKDTGESIDENHLIIKDNTQQLQELMKNYAGIVRNNQGLHKAKTQLQSIYKEVGDLYQKTKINTALCELRNMVNVSHLIIDQSLGRSINKGGYFNIDYSPDYKNLYL